MTITLELTPEEEASLRRRSARAGVTPEEYLRRSLTAKSRKTTSERTLADRVAEVLGKPELGRGGTSNWSEVEAACDAGHDSTFECIAEGYDWEKHQGSIAGQTERMLKKLFSGFEAGE